MGQPKLLLPVAGQPLILHTLAAWKHSRVDRIIVVVRPNDPALIDVIHGADVDTVIPPAAPSDMKASLGYALAHVAVTYRPSADDCWLVAPADMPGIASPIINRLLDQAAANPRQVIIPTLAGRRGHPVLLPWSLAGEVPQLPQQEGLNWLIDRCNPQLVTCDDLAANAENAFADIDTPDDLRAFSNPGARRAN